MPKLVIVAGCAGSGKTTISKELARKTHYTMLDKDPMTRRFTDFILCREGSFEGDRESDFYCNNLRDIEYEILFETAKENLELGNSVILSSPFIAIIQNYDMWKESGWIKDDFIEKYDVEIKFIWMKHDIDLEYERISKRSAKRDKNKLDNWEEYKRSLDNISIDDRYDAYIVDNSKSNNILETVDNIIKWLENGLNK